VAAVLKKEMGIVATLVEGAHGSCVVQVDGETVYSKSERDGLPSSQDILELVQARQG
jgi:hypothetical protein